MSYDEFYSGIDGFYSGIDETTVMQQAEVINRLQQALAERTTALEERTRERDEIAMTSTAAIKEQIGLTERMAQERTEDRAAILDVDAALRNMTGQECLNYLTRVWTQRYAPAISRAQDPA